MATPSVSTTLHYNDVPQADALAADYVYCVVEDSRSASLGPVGIEGREVYVVAHRGLGALVHASPPLAYQATDREIAGAWVLAHHQVVDSAWRRWGTVLPLTFNTIVLPGATGADQSVTAWLDREHEHLQGKLQALAGKAEYGVQVSCDSSHLVEQALAANPDIGKLQEQANSPSRGLAYMYRQQLETVLKRAVEGQALRESAQLYGKLRACADDTRLEKTKAAGDGQTMLLNLSCLVSPERLAGLEMAVQGLRGMAGLSVRMVGPFPPYSFC